MTPSRSCSVSPIELGAAITERDDGVEIAVYVQPRASRTRIVGLHDGRLKVALAAPPVDGKANKALIAFLATTLGVSRSDLALAAGESSRRKRVRVLGLDAAQVERLLEGRDRQPG